MKPARKLLWAVGVLIACVLAVAVCFYERPVSFFDRLLAFQMTSAGAHSKTIQIAGHRIHYYEQGPDTGAPVVLVHGLGGHAEDWHNLAPYLAHAGFHVFAPDLLGFGRSDRPADFTYSISDQAASVYAFMDALGLKQVDLGGWSMGGWIVQRMAYTHPERVKRLMLFDSAGIYEQPAWNVALFTPTSEAELSQLDALLTPRPPTVPGFIARDILRISREHAWVIHRALDSMMTGKDATDSILPQLKMPVLIVWGQEDHITPVSQGKRIHELIPHSNLDIVAGCGHLAPAQCADRIGPTVAEFLR